MMDRAPEFALLIEACRAAFENRPLGPTAWNRTMDLPRFVRLVRFHRVQGVAWQSLASAELPTEAAQAISSDAQSIAEANLRTALASAAILAAFEQAGVLLMFVKGLTLAKLAYGTIATKSAIDMDLLVEEGALADGTRLLRELGYELEAPRGVYEGLGAWHRLRKESVWWHRDNCLQIDLHTRLADNRQLISKVGLQSPRQFVDVAPGITLPTLGPDELFAYLCVHGASSAWFRLKWIADLAALLQRAPPSELESLYRKSQLLGAGRAAMQALLLADELFGNLSTVPALRRTLRKDRAANWLLRAALQQLSEQEEPVEPTSKPLGTARIHLSQFALLPGWRFKASELVRQARVTLS